MLRNAALLVLPVIAAFLLPVAPGAAQEASSAEFREVAPDLYFYFDFNRSNSAVLITDEGVLVVDSTMHPDDAEDLLAKIRAQTDAPIRYVVNSQHHGDHYMGNSVFEREGAIFIQHPDTLAVIEQRFQYEVETRPFRPRGQDPAAVTLVRPDILFDSRATIRLGGRTVELLYLGAGQNEGDTLVYFPHARALHTGGVFHNRSWANTSFAHSFEGWVNVLRAMKSIGAEIYLPPHGDLATEADLDAFTDFIELISTEVRAAIDAGKSLEDMLETLTFDEYRDWRGYGRRERNLRAIYQLMTTGQPQYLVPVSSVQPVSGN